jgi:hypothetical protein
LFRNSSGFGAFFRFQSWDNDLIKTIADVMQKKVELPYIIIDIFECNVLSFDICLYTQDGDFSIIRQRNTGEPYMAISASLDIFIMSNSPISQSDTPTNYGRIQVDVENKKTTFNIDNDEYELEQPIPYQHPDVYFLAEIAVFKQLMRTRPQLFVRTPNPIQSVLETISTNNAIEEIRKKSTEAYKDFANLFPGITTSIPTGLDSDLVVNTMSNARMLPFFSLEYDKEHCVLHLKSNKLGEEKVVKLAILGEKPDCLAEIKVLDDIFDQFSGPTTVEFGKKTLE